MKILMHVFALLASIAHAQTPAFTVDASSPDEGSGFVGIQTSSPAATLDVNGNAQFGSGATKSTFTATGLLQLTSSGIEWGDGSLSTTSASNTPGVAILTATQTFTGANQFSAGATIGQGVYLSTLSYANLLHGSRTIVGGANLASAKSLIEFTNVSSSTYFTLTFNSSVTTTGWFYFLCHNTTTSYQYGGYRMNQGGNAALSSGAQTVKGALMDSTDPCLAGHTALGTVHFNWDATGLRWDASTSCLDASNGDDDYHILSGHNESSGCRITAPSDIEFGNTGAFMGQVYFEALTP